MEWDPLLAKGDAVLEDHFLADQLGQARAGKRNSKQRAQAVSIIVIPFFIFLVHLALWTSEFHAWPFIVLGIQVATFALSVLLAMFFTESKLQRYVDRLAFYMCTATVVSLGCGIYVYYKYAVYYFSYEDLRRYTNVQASQTPDSFQDSGLLEFAHTSHVDITRAVGYKSYMHGGRVFCVAPIRDQSMTLSTEIGFWAVGIDCCSKRASFECGSANDPAAHSGVILLQDDVVAPEALKWVLNWFSDRPWAEFDAALRLQNAAFGTSMAKNRILVRWERYPLRIQEEFRRDGVATAVMCCALYFVFTLITGVGYSKYHCAEKR